MGERSRSSRAEMITPVECREHAVECRQIAGRAPNSRVQSILIDMARMWDRLAIEAEHSQGNAGLLRLITPQAAATVDEPFSNNAEKRPSSEL
jgi:hypothetical protein